ncbi:MAG: lysophospholipid acyltransferase family protein [Candidatus Aminicenantes bacterium]
MIKNIKNYLVSLIIYLVAGLCFCLWAIFLIIFSIFYTGPLFERLLKIGGKSVLFCAGIRVNITGIENVDPQKQYIVMMNHVNIFDGFVFISRFPGKARGVEEESHFKWPFYGWLIRRMKMIPINRKSGIKAMTALKKAADLIRKKKDFSVAVLPEGTRTITGKLGNFKKGGFLLALETGLDILPMIQVGSFKINRKKSRIIRPGKIHLVFEKAIPTSGYSKDNIKELMDKTRNVFLKYVD